MKLNTLLSMYIWTILSTIWFSSLSAQETPDYEPGTILIKFGKEDLQLPAGNLELIHINSTKIRSLLQNAGFEEGARIFPNFLPRDTLRTTPKGHRVRLIDLSRYFKIKVGTETDLNALVDSLKKVPSIDYVGLNWAVHPMQVSINDPLSLKQSGFTPIKALSAWSLSTGGDVKIAVIDGGVDYNHQDLDPGNRTRIIAGWDFGNGDSDPMDDLSGDWANHGTQVAGVIGAITNNTRGISGMCWQTQIIPVKAIASGADVVFGAYRSTFAQGVDYAVRQGADVINMSFSPFTNIWGELVYQVQTLLHHKDPLAAACYNAFSSGVVLVAAAGNDDAERAYIPARYPYTFAVGAATVSSPPQRVTISTSSTWGSNYGNHIDIVAPGVQHHSTSRGNLYEEFRGTSLAAPIVSGVAGLLVAENKERALGLTNEDLMQIIRISANDITSDPVGGTGLVGWDKYTGHGMVDAYRALQFLQPTYSVVRGNASGGTSVLFQGDHLHTFYNNNGLASGRYFVEIYEVTKDISFSESFAKIPEVWIRSIGTVGWSAANPNDELNWAEVVPGSITKTGCKLRTFVYFVKNNMDGDAVNEWWPCEASEVQFAYTAIGVGQSDVSGELYEDATWSGSVRVNGDITIPSNVTLTIAKGTDIHFTANTDETGGGKDQTRSELIVKGTLDADAGDITFRSTDDPAGNDDWYGIRVAIGGTADLSGATVQDGFRCVQNEGGTLTVDANTTLSNCGSTVTLTPTTPYVGQEITATLTPTGSITATDVQWQWQRRRSTDGWTNITSATNPAYTPTVEDIGSQFRATVRYQAEANVYPRAQSAATDAVQAGLPGVPPHFMVSAGRRHVVLQWEAAAANGSPIVRYEFQWREVNEANSEQAWPERTWASVSGGGTARYVMIMGLTNGTEYEFAVRAVNGVGAGEPASAPATPEGTVVPLWLTASRGDGQVSLQWTIPLNAPPIARYEVRQRVSDSGQDWSSWSGGITARDTTITGLTNGVTYQFEVQAVNSKGIVVGASHPATATPAGLPGVPPDFMPSAGDGQVVLGWEAAANNGSRIKRYEIQWRQVSDPAQDWSSWSPVSGGRSARDTTVTGLTNGQPYEFAVRAVNGVGAGEPASAPATPKRSSVVSFGSVSYEATEGGTGVSIGVSLSPVVSQAVRIPVVVSADAGTEAGDYAVAGLTDGTVWLSFAAGVSSQSFTITANEDADSADETVTVSFGSLPLGVSAVGDCVRGRALGDGRCVGDSRWGVVVFAIGGTGCPSG